MLAYIGVNHVQCAWVCACVYVCACAPVRVRVCMCVSLYVCFYTSVRVPPSVRARARARYVIYIANRRQLPAIQHAHLPNLSLDIDLQRSVGFTHSNNITCHTSYNVLSIPYAPVPHGCVLHGRCCTSCVSMLVRLRRPPPHPASHSENLGH